MATQAVPIVANGIDSVCYCAKDFARAKNFYVTNLGLRPSTEAEGWVEFDLDDGTSFAIVQLPDGAFHQTGGVMFSVPDAHAAYERLTGAGVTVHGEIYESPVCFMAWFDDSEGNNFAVHQRKATA